MANLILSPGKSYSVPIAARNGAFVSPSWDIAPGSTGTITFQIDVLLAEQTDPTKRISAQIEALMADGITWQHQCGVEWIGGDYSASTKPQYPAHCTFSVNDIAGRTVRITGYAGNASTQTPNTIHAGATVRVDP